MRRSPQEIGRKVEGTPVQMLCSINVWVSFLHIKYLWYSTVSYCQFPYQVICNGYCYVRESISSFSLNGGLQHLKVTWKMWVNAGWRAADTYWFQGSLSFVSISHYPCVCEGSFHTPFCHARSPGVLSQSSLATGFRNGPFMSPNSGVFLGNNSAMQTEMHIVHSKSPS